jgi:hypothetical protein
MPSAEYLRRQADICLRLSLAASDTDSANRLIMMAEEYKLRAAEADAEPASPPAQPKDPSPNRATGSAVVQQQQQQQQQPSGGATPGPADRQPEEP